jgi:hypothetical protein
MLGSRQYAVRREGEAGGSEHNGDREAIDAFVLNDTS